VAALCDRTRSNASLQSSACSPKVVTLSEVEPSRTRRRCCLRQRSCRPTTELAQKRKSVLLPPPFPKKRSHLSFFCNLHITLPYRDLRSILPSGNLGSFRRKHVFRPAPSLENRVLNTPPLFLLPFHFPVRCRLGEGGYLSSCPDHTPSKAPRPVKLSLYDIQAQTTLRARSLRGRSGCRLLDDSLQTEAQPSWQ
jgi:hypothetical protein